MANAQCLCGALSLKLRETSKLIVAYCLACQRRTGSSFGLGVFHAIDTVEISGTATEFIHVGDSGRKVRCYFLSNMRLDGLLEARRLAIFNRRRGWRARRPWLSGSRLFDIRAVEASLGPC